MVDLPSSPLAAIDPQFETMALETGGLTYGLTGTSVREKLLQDIANDVCRLHLGLAFAAARDCGEHARDPVCRPARADPVRRTVRRLPGSGGRPRPDR
jgi:hypothetical protein